MTILSVACLWLLCYLVIPPCHQVAHMNELNLESFNGTWFERNRGGNMNNQAKDCFQIDIITDTDQEPIFIKNSKNATILQ